MYYILLSTYLYLQKKQEQQQTDIVFYVQYWAVILHKQILS